MKIWNEAFDAGKARIDDQFLDRLIAMYRARAKIYQGISWLLLLVTSIMIFAGVMTFIHGDRGDEVLAESEVALRQQIDQTQQKIDALDIENARTEENVSKLRRAEVLASILANAKSGVVGLLESRERRLVPSTQKVIRASESIVENLDRPAPPASVTIVVSDVVLNDSNKFPSLALEQVTLAAVDNSVNLADLRLELKEIAAELERLTRLAIPKEESLVPEAEIGAFRSVAERSDQLLRLDSVHSTVTRQVEQAEREAQTNSEEKTKRVGEEVQLNKQKERLEGELVKVREQREKILFMAWIPGLTLRVGTVVLLLFLTQILLATYRYTVGLSGFYLARSDAIQLVQCDLANPPRYALEQLQILMEALTPSRYRVDPVKDPSEHLTDLAKTWVNRKAT